MPTQQRRRAHGCAVTSPATTQRRRRRLAYDVAGSAPTQAACPRLCRPSNDEDDLLTAAPSRRQTTCPRRHQSSNNPATATVTLPRRGRSSPNADDMSTPAPTQQHHERTSTPSPVQRQSSDDNEGLPPPVPTQQHDGRPAHAVTGPVTTQGQQGGLTRTHADLPSHATSRTAHPCPFQPSISTEDPPTPLPAQQRPIGDEDDQPADTPRGRQTRKSARTACANAVGMRTTRYNQPALRTAGAHAFASAFTTPTAIGPVIIAALRLEAVSSLADHLGLSPRSLPHRDRVLTARNRVIALLPRAAAAFALSGYIARAPCLQFTTDFIWPPLPLHILSNISGQVLTALRRMYPQSGRTVLRLPPLLPCTVLQPALRPVAAVPLVSDLGTGLPHLRTTLEHMLRHPGIALRHARWRYLGLCFTFICIFAFCSYIYLYSVL